MKVIKSRIWFLLLFLLILNTNKVFTQNTNDLVYNNHVFNLHENNYYTPVTGSIRKSTGYSLLLSLSSTIESNKKDYYGALENGQKSNEITTWVNYFIQVIIDAQKSAEALIDFILKKAHEFNLDAVQLHGKETPEFCSELISPLERGLRGVSFKIIKAFNISDAFDFKQLNAYEACCDYFLFDAFGKKAGGNGITFNWDLLSKYNGKTPFLLSGGIDETMVSEIKKINHPQFIGIDINSGFEIEPALKDVEKIKEFNKMLRH